MFCNKWVALWGLFFFISFAVNSSALMTDEKIEKYIALKLKRNDRVLRLNEKSIGDDGAKFLATSPLLESVETLIIYKGNIRDEGVRALAGFKKTSSINSTLLREQSYYRSRR